MVAAPWSDGAAGSGHGQGRRTENRSDEKKDLVGVSEEYLRDRLARFQGYRQILQKRADDYQAQIEACKAEVASKEIDADQPNKVMVQEASKSSADRAQVNSFMCAFVKPGASLQGLMMNAFAKVGCRFRTSAWTRTWLRPR